MHYIIMFFAGYNTVLLPSETPHNNRDPVYARVFSARTINNMMMMISLSNNMYHTCALVMGRLRIRGTEERNIQEFSDFLLRSQLSFLRQISFLIFSILRRA